MNSVKRIFPVLWGIPLFGIIACLLEILEERRSNEARSGYLRLVYNNSLKKTSSAVDSEDDIASSIVPVEEALVSVDNEAQRKLVYMLLDGMTSENMPLLKKIHGSDDIELTHFAATKMIELRREFEKKIFERRRQLDENPQDRMALENYCRALDDYLSSGLPTESARYQYVQRKEEAMKQLSSLFPDIPRYQRQYLELVMEKGNLDDDVQAEILRLLKEWPLDARSYRLMMEYCFLKKDRKSVDEVLDKIVEKGVYMNAEAQKWYGFWRA